MKKFKQLVLLFIVATVALVSCNKDDDSGSGSIEGSWELSKVGSVVDGQEVLIDYPGHTAGCTKDYVEFKSGGVAVEHYFYDDNDGSGCYEEADSASWTKDGNTLTITYADSVQIGEILELSGSTLKVKTTDSDTQEIIIIVYSRK